MKFGITDLIYRVPNFLSDSECDSLIKEYEERSTYAELEHCLDANTGIDTYSTFTRLSLDEGTESYNFMFRKTEEAVNGYIKHLDSFGNFHSPLLRKAFLYSHAFRLLKYGVGDKIHPHTDHDTYIYGSVTFNLNDDYTGGVFKFFNGDYEVHLQKGEMMIWPADFFWVHEITPVETGCRYSTNSFLTSIPPYMMQEQTQNLRDIYDRDSTCIPPAYQIK